MITVPKVLRVIPLKEYSPEFGELVVEVWANPPRAMGQKRVELLQRAITTTPTDELDRELFAWYAEIWSQGVRSEQWTPEEVWRTYEQSPDFIRWLIERTNAEFEAQREHAKKA